VQTIIRDHLALGTVASHQPKQVRTVLRDAGFDPWTPLLLRRMEFKRFLAVWLLLPCQIVRSGRQLIYRVLTYSEWVEVLLSSVDRLRRLTLT
jgi:hypothetical protein